MYGLLDDTRKDEDETEQISTYVGLKDALMTVFQNIQDVVTFSFAQLHGDLYMDMS